jgi:hypothetical protein
MVSIEVWSMTKNTLRQRHKSRRRPATALLGRCVAEKSKYKRLNLYSGQFTLAAMARTALRGPPGYRTGPLARAKSRTRVRLDSIRGFMFSSCFYILYKIRSGLMTIHDWLSCFRGVAGTTQAVTQSPDHRSVYIAQG